MIYLFMKDSDEYMKAVEALEEETLRLRTQAAEAEEEKVVILKLSNDLKKEVSTFLIKIILSYSPATVRPFPKSVYCTVICF